MDVARTTIRLVADKPLAAANAVALMLPLSLLLGAILFERVGGLVPCEMCMMQRWPHFAAAALATIALFVRHAAARRILVACAAGAMLTSAGIAIDHLGVERHWWAGHTACTAALPTGLSTAEFLERMMRMPLVRCDTAQWTILGLSLADLNAIASTAGAAVAGWLVLRARRKDGDDAAVAA